MVAVAGSAVIRALVPESRLVRSLALLYAAWMAASVSISFHWLSDGIAGVIVGTVIGDVVARSARPSAA